MAPSDDDITTRWDGMVARQDPDRYAAQLLREKRQAGKAGAIIRHQQNMESYREKSLELAEVQGKKPAPFDEFTVFGQPSGPITAGQAGRESAGVWACMRFEDAERKPPVPPVPKGPKGQLLGEVMEFEPALRGVFPYPHGHDRRPLSTSKERYPGYAPPAATRSARSNATAVRFGSGKQRPLTSITAYQKAGLGPVNAGFLTKGATSAIDNWRAGSKVEEQMLLGHLRADLAKFTPQSPRMMWKLSQFEKVPARM